MAQPTQPLAANRTRPAPGGLVAAAVMGALSSLLTGGLWSFLAVVIGDLDAALPLGWTLLSGTGLGLGLAFFRHGKTSPWPATLGLGLVVGALWLGLTGGQDRWDSSKSARSGASPPAC